MLIRSAVDRISAFSLVGARPQFVACWEQDLKNHLRYLFEGDEIIEQKQDLLYRISAS